MDGNPFYWFSIFEDLKYGAVCNAVTSGLRKAGFGPSQQKAFYWQESEVPITICYLARI